VMQHHGGGENYELSSKHAVKVKTAEHTATSQLNIQNGRIILTQEFREGDYYNASAVAISIVGRPSKARYLNELTVQLTAAPGKGKFTIMIGSASSFDPNQDVAELALKELYEAESEGFGGLRVSNQEWWHDFWSKSFVHLHSEDGVADYIEQNYTYYLYLMASSSRGTYPPRFGGMLWYATGDQHAWGSQFWWYNQSCLYEPMFPTNRFELMDPMFSMYSSNYDSYALAARQQWGSKGIWLPETSWFDGMEELPEDIAQEMRDLYLVRKPWEERSDRFRYYCETKLKHNSRWNWAGVGNWDQGHWTFADKGTGAFGHVTHILSDAAKMSYLYWLRYEYTQDEVWLRKHAYPMLKGTVEFYRNFPNVRKDSTGKYQIYNVNNQEGAWNAQNTMEEIAAMHGMTPILIRASEILNVDADMRPVWKEFVENLAPFPTSDNLPESMGPIHWIGAVSRIRFRNTTGLAKPTLLPAIHYDLCTVGTTNKEMISQANATYEAIYPQGISENEIVTILDKNPLAAAHLGRSGDIKYMIPNQIRHIVPDYDMDDPQKPVLPNLFDLQEGEGALSCERLGVAALAMHAALLQSVPSAPGKEPVIHLFPSWPREWDATYTLAARGAFLVTASIENGEIEMVGIKSQAGGECRIENPWPGKRLTIYRNSKRAGKTSGKMIVFSTNPGEVVALVPGSTKLPVKIIPKK
jgi:hypothetical protein